MKQTLRKLFILFLFLSGQKYLFCLGNYSWDFSSCEIKDILFAVSLDTGIPISADDTVTGKADFRFSGPDFETAFDTFLLSSRLFCSKTDKVWYVSRSRIITQEDGRFTADFYDLPASSVIEKISLTLDKPVSFENLPSGNVNFHVKNVTEDELLSVFVRSLSGYELKKNEPGWHIAKENRNKSWQEAGVSRVCRLNLNPESGNMEIDIADCTLRDAVEKLFFVFEKDFCILSNADTKISRSKFTAISFEDALEKICLQNNLTYILKNGVYYILSANKSNITGDEACWKIFSVNGGNLEKTVSLLKQRFSHMEVIVFPDGKSFSACVTPSEEAFINSINEERKTFLITLKNMKSSEFIENLPKSVDLKTVSRADSNSGIYFTGTDTEYRDFLKQVEIWDKASVRLRYDLLILQYDDSKDSSWDSGFSARSIKKGDRPQASAMLGSVLSLNMNVITAFGLDFAVKLQSSISENKARVFADTTLYGVAGKPIGFQNSTTYRYRDNNLDPETGKPVYSGITKEIISGLKLDITGWVSADGNITSSVKASVSRRGSDSSAITGNPPPTTEKILSTEVLGKDGEPVVLTGLIQSAETEDAVRTPLASRIPLIGKFFKQNHKTTEKSQMVIYLVPHVENQHEISGENPEKFNEEWAKEYKEEICRIMNSN